MERINQLGARNAQKSPAKGYEGSFSLEFFPTGAAKWWKLVMGSVADAGAGPYTHTYAEANTIPSFSMENGIDLSTDSVMTLLGCKINTLTISAAVNEMVKAKADCLYANETEGTTLSSQVNDTEEPFVFSEATLEVPSSTVLDRVQSFELTINNNPEGVRGLGSRYFSTAPVKNRVYDFKLRMTYESAVQLERFYGAATGPNATVAATASLVFKFTNGDTSPATDERKHVVTLTNIFFDEFSLPQDPADLLYQEISGWALSGSVVVTNNTNLG